MISMPQLRTSLGSSSSRVALPPPNMEEADVLYGVTMQEQGVSRMLTINLNDVEKELNIR